MKSLIIKGDDVSPDVNFNPETGILEMKGVAIPEDVRDMFEPIIKWLKEYIGNPKTATELILYFDYLNTAASKMIYQICDMISDLHGNEEYNSKITWKYNRGDSEMLELGEDLMESFVCLKNILAVETAF
ncbi:MAG: DUF1987 domain-containing protein [Bacteroidales bacterium]|nr:DUF1987 domain-containing protein [Bacteroidales bacterium]MBN2819343.1 DUF1987 domain-containing protein [Bacteroidales bacterium]